MAEGSLIRQQLRARVHAALGLNENDVVSMNEIRCLDPGCPDVETVILVMRPSKRTVAIKIPVALADLSDVELLQATEQLDDSRESNKPC
jgi:hypothetical protein